jgi:hypothetical protein
MNSNLQIAPNKPVTVALVNPEGAFDFDIGIGLYETTGGQTFTLPRPAVVILNALDPDPGEEITITKHWSGKPGDKAEWSVTRATGQKSAQEPAEGSGATESPTQAPKEAVAPPVPIGRPPRRRLSPEVQPGLFDFGTGTHGLPT